MRWIILGSQGQIGRALTRQAEERNIVALSLSRNDLDIRDPTPLRDLITSSRPDVIINAAAHTAVDRAEDEAVDAFKINATAPGELAKICQQESLPLIHFSSDCVFDGEKDTPYEENDEVNPISVYGLSKEAGESAIRRVLPQHLILRTSWVFSADRSNFVYAMLTLAKERTHLRIVDDQIGGPTSAAYLAAAVDQITKQLETDNVPWGTYHIAGADPVSRHRFAVEIFTIWRELTGMTAPSLEAISTDAFPALAARPKNSVLDCQKIQANFGIAPCNWRTDLRRALEDLAANNTIS
jgi:dTDP-4-dehydrorhamnose reductase